MAGAWLWVRREWRRHGAGLAGLSLLIAVVAGVTLAVAGGAERTASAFERFQKATNAFQIGVDLRQPETQGSLDIAAVPTAEELAERVSAVDGVRGVARGDVRGRLAGSELAEPVLDRAHRSPRPGPDSPPPRGAVPGRQRRGRDRRQ